MHPVTAKFLAAVRTSHVPLSRVDAYLDNQLLLSDLPVVAGSVTVDAGSAVRRQLDLTIADATLLPSAVDENAPYGVQLRVSRGIRFSDGTSEMVPLGRFRVDSVRSNIGEPLQVTGVDPAATVSDAKFLSLTQAVATNSIVAEITRLIQSVLPATTVTNVNVPTTHMTPTLTWESDPWTAAQDLAESVGAEVFFDGTGSAVLRLIPDATDTDPVWLVDSGDGGVLVTYSREISRTDTYNAVVASGERADAYTPVRAVVYDSDPDSPTVWGGAFGRVPYFYTSPILTTLAGATAAATGLLNRKRALGRQVSLSAVPNPALDAGDVIGVWLPDGTLERYLIDRVTIPLTLGDPVQIDARTPQPILLVTDLPPASPNPGGYTPPVPEDFAPDGSFEPIDYPPWEPVDGFPVPEIPFGDFPPMPNIPLEPPPFGDLWPQTITFEHTVEGPTETGGVGAGWVGEHSYETHWVNGDEQFPGSVTWDYAIASAPAYGGTGSVEGEVSWDVAAPNGSNQTTLSPVPSAGMWWRNTTTEEVVLVGVFNLANIVGTSVAPQPISLPASDAEHGFEHLDLRISLVPGETTIVGTYYPQGHSFRPPGTEREVVGFAWLPETLPHVIVKLDGVEQEAETYDIDYVEGHLTILPAMGAVAGQTLEITYVTNGVISLYYSPEPVVPQLPQRPDRRGGGGTF